MVSLFFFLILSSCNSETIVASVGEEELSDSELFILMKNEGLDPKKISEKKLFIENWIKKQLYLQELRERHPDKWKEIILRSELYAGELAKVYLEEEFNNKRLSKTINEEELNTFYEEHKEDYILQDYLVRGLLLKIRKESNFKEAKIDQYFLLKNDKDLVQLDSYAKLYAENYYYDDSSWIYFEEFMKDVPVNAYNKDRIVLNRSKTYFADEEYVYFVNVLDYKLKDEAPPLEFLKEQIKEQILMLRYQNLKVKNENKLLDQIKKKHEIIRNY